MGAFLLLLPLLASATCVSAHVYLLTPEQVHAAYHNHGALHSHTQPDGTVIFFEDHTHMPYYYNMVEYQYTYLHTNMTSDQA